MWFQGSIMVCSFSTNLNGFKETTGKKEPKSHPQNCQIHCHVETSYPRSVNALMLCHIMYINIMSKSTNCWIPVVKAPNNWRIHAAFYHRGVVPLAFCSISAPDHWGFKCPEAARQDQDQDPTRWLVPEKNAPLVLYYEIYIYIYIYLGHTSTNHNKGLCIYNDIYIYIYIYIIIYVESIYLHVYISLYIWYYIIIINYVQLVTRYNQQNFLPSSLLKSPIARLKNLPAHCLGTQKVPSLNFGTQPPLRQCPILAATEKRLKKYKTCIVPRWYVIYVDIYIYIYI